MLTCMNVGMVLIMVQNKEVPAYKTNYKQLRVW